MAKSRTLDLFHLIFLAGQRRTEDPESLSVLPGSQAGLAKTMAFMYRQEPPKGSAKIFLFSRLQGL